MATTPIGKDHDLDPFYRYKRPVIKVAISGHGRNTHTLITNLEQIAKAIHRDSSYILKYLAYEKNLVVKKYKDDIAITGEYDVGTLEQYLDDFIEVYVICANCNLPETNFTKNEDDCLVYTCNSCSYCYTYPATKLSKYICNQI